MHGDILGLLLSFVLVLFFIGLSFIVVKSGRRLFGDSCPEVARKVVHIGVSNWFFIYCFVFETDIWPIVGLGFFTLANALMNVTGLLSVLMGQDSRTRNWGLVQYPVSIIIVILLKHFGLGDMAAVGCAVLAMGYGDGLASLVGKAVKSKRLGSWTKKTYAGSITMVCLTMIVVILMKVFIGGVSFTGTLVLKAALVAVFAALVEAFTPFGLDNMSVPIAIFLVMRFV